MKTRDTPIITTIRHDHHKENHCINHHCYNNNNNNNNNNIDQNHSFSRDEGEQWEHSEF